MLLSRDENEALGCFYHRSVMESFPTQTLSRVACECLCPVAPLKQVWRSSSVRLVEYVHVCPIIDVTVAAGASEARGSALCSPSNKPSTPAVTSLWNRGPESAGRPTKSHSCTLNVPADPIYQRNYGKSLPRELVSSLHNGTHLTGALIWLLNT